MPSEKRKSQKGTKCRLAIKRRLKLIYGGNLSRLSKLIELCSNSVIIYINQHRNYYQTIEEYLESLFYRNGGDWDIDEINKETLEKMIETDTFVELTFYPNSAIGSFDVWHYDIDKAVDLAITIAEEWKDSI